VGSWQIYSLGAAVPVIGCWSERQPRGNTAQGWFNIGMDSDGSFVVALASNSADIPATSTDYGVTWSNIAPINRSYTVDIACSQTGQYLIAIVHEDLLFISNDYGATWTAPNIYPSDPPNTGNVWSCVDISGDGSFMIAGMHSNSYSIRSELWTSSDYGNTWILRTVGSWDQHRTNCIRVACDGDGSNIVLSMSGTWSAPDAPGPLYLSSDYGATWTQCTTIVPVQLFGTHNGSWIGLDTNNDGSVIIACAGGYGAPDIRGVWVSTDYGNSWNKIITDGSDYWNWYSVACSSDGSCMVACHESIISGRYGRIYSSMDYGSTWHEIKPTANVDHFWVSVKLSGDGHRMAVGDGNNGYSPYSGRLYITTSSDCWKNG
jgi:photosystem II stability/assembly factor-like uncharacterized protein